MRMHYVLDIARSLEKRNENLSLVIKAEYGSCTEASAGPAK